MIIRQNIILKNNSKVREIQGYKEVLCNITLPYYKNDLKYNIMTLREI